jgi:hypothetical protein
MDTDKHQKIIDYLESIDCRNVQMEEDNDNYAYRFTCVFGYRHTLLSHTILRDSVVKVRREDKYCINPYFHQYVIK